MRGRYSEMKKIAIVSFRGETPCFVHALLNVWKYYQRGYQGHLIAPVELLPKGL